ncbi:MAG: hypothetical protein ABI947_08320 [Chloroflexota bacterium]
MILSVPAAAGENLRSNPKLSDHVAAPHDDSRPKNLALYISCYERPTLLE